MHRTAAVLALLTAVAACSDTTGVAPPLEPAAPAVSAAAASASHVFGPETFTRDHGAPAPVTRSISLQGFTAPFTLHVQNGDAAGASRVSSAIIGIDGKAVFSQRDFSQQVGSLSRGVELSDPSTLTVLLAGTPGSFVRIWVEGVPSSPATLFCPGAVDGHETMWAAVDATPSGGTVQVCEGEHVVEGITIGKPLTIEPVPGATPVLTPTNWVMFDIESDEVHIRDLTFKGGDYSVSAEGVSGVRVAGSTFIGQAQHAVQFRNASGTISDNVFDGALDATLSSAIDLHLHDADLLVTVADNTVGGKFDHGIVANGSGTVAIERNFLTAGAPGGSNGIVTRGNPGRISGNVLDGCGRHCIFPVSGAGKMVVDSNRMTLEKSDHNFIAIIGYSYEGAGELIIENNHIEGLGTPADPANFGDYTIEASGIQVDGWRWDLTDEPLDRAPGALVVVRGNYVRNAAKGIGSGMGANMYVADNVVELTHAAASTWERGRITLFENDFTAYQRALVQGESDEPDEWVVATCNWWGTAAGPQNVTGVPAEQYTPWATAPAAGPATAECDGGI